MKPTTTYERLVVGAKVREINRMMAAYKHKLFELMSHPDTTYAEITTVQGRIQNLDNRMKAMNQRLFEEGYDPNLII